MAPKFYHKFCARVKRFYRRLSTLNRRQSGKLYNVLISVTMLNYINHNDLGSITTYVAPQHRRSTCCASAKTQVQNLGGAPVANQCKCKILLVCANIIVQILDSSQVNNSDPKPHKPHSWHNKKACTVAGFL